MIPHQQVRLLVHAEGPTEAGFVDLVLAPHLRKRGYGPVATRTFGGSGERIRRGGIRSWTTVRDGILRTLKEDQNLVVTTMADFYGMRPRSGPDAWPGIQPDNRNLPTMERARSIMGAMSADVHSRYRGYLRGRFIPFVMMHEFEGILFRDCATLAAAAQRPNAVSLLQRIRDAFPTPEDINDSSQSAPSKRLQELLGKRKKAVFGPEAAHAIGLPRLRQECPILSDWVSRLEQYPRDSANVG